MDRRELVTAFRNVQRVQDNGCKFPPDLTTVEKGNLRILADALLESGFAGDAYDILRDAFERRARRAA